MKVWIITDEQGVYVSAWRTEEPARAELDRLNARYRAKYGRDRYEMQEDELNG